MTRMTWLALAALPLVSCHRVMAPDTATVRAPSDAMARGTSSLSAAIRGDAAFGAVPRAQVLDDVRAQVPVVTLTRVFADANGVHFQFYLRPELRRDRPFYGPRIPGGWQFQLFLDTDRDTHTGYGWGYEYLTRDSDAHLPAGTVDLRHTLGGGGPGGWGGLVANLPASVQPGSIRLTVPLALIEDDGVLDFRLEMYATVLGGEDGETPVANGVRYYTGTSSLTVSGEDETIAEVVVIPSR